ncbi:MAG: hypothetical protein JST87_17400 [Bacteroidetes bacterium]|nr:hypothetical protein [Bacteroidota bacterium]
MSLLNNSNKGKKGSKSGGKQNTKTGFQTGKVKTNTKGSAKATKFTGGAQRGS